ncbi:Initiation-control protein YabA [Tetragenococcus halophilus subsp. halophilus]|mgnify:FL=1|nr:DNA replication initiation control protein YabA [Tetragenococcus halophilus]RQD29327.1 DUF972 domain-containing protein [Tetragenococcus halophilus subsp. halophilus DSM 20339]GBD59953.1 Initiation-control protein YabA [Tetragenococcus halophilus subsp. halophilus]GMA07099.1 initiation-control protein YabA [Tetragenococcus halophilus subsp. flandriensis]GBD61173.1 Initiation-control protein YabA [Tetragenococcus halophilus subsp. halophilus]
MSMDKRSLYDGLNEFDEDLQKLSQNLMEMKDSLQELVEKNATLELENQRLRERIHELSQQDAKLPEKEKQELSRSRLNLEKIYEEGFHVCYDLYGARREHDEPCAFCLEVIYRDSSNK